MDQAAHSFSLTPLSPYTGAEIRGLDLRQPVDAATRAGLNRAFEDHAVLAIRDQQLARRNSCKPCKFSANVSTA